LSGSPFVLIQSWPGFLCGLLYRVDAAAFALGIPRLA
jgi:hypothetical protein